MTRRLDGKLSFGRAYLFELFSECRQFAVQLGWLQTPEEPLLGFARAGSFVPFTPLTNITGQPAISLPLSWNADNLPIGSHLIAEYGREDLLLRVASQLEQAKPWADRIPPVHV